MSPYFDKLIIEGIPQCERYAYDHPNHRSYYQLNQQAHENSFGDGKLMFAAKSCKNGLNLDKIASYLHRKWFDSYKWDHVSIKQVVEYEKNDRMPYEQCESNFQQICDMISKKLPEIAMPWWPMIGKMIPGDKDSVDKEIYRVYRENSIFNRDCATLGKSMCEEVVKLMNEDAHLTTKEKEKRLEQELDRITQVHTQLTNRKEIMNHILNEQTDTSNIEID